MSRFKKFLYILMGILAVVLGAIGAVLPVLPTTPFLLLALYSFSKGSKRWNDWFIGTRLYKKYLEDYCQRRAMSLKQKVSILLFADFMMAFPFIIINSLLLRLFLLTVIAFKYYYFIFKIKTIRPQSEERVNDSRWKLDEQN